MARPREADVHTVPRSVAMIVRAICADYSRREHHIKYTGITGEVLEEYVRLNGLINEAIGTAESGTRNTILADIALGRGYDYSMASPYLSKNTYYARKRRIVYDIAKSLRLI